VNEKIIRINICDIRIMPDVSNKFGARRSDADALDFGTRGDKRADILGPQRLFRPASV
jgi:hypothetical protein